MTGNLTAEILAENKPFMDAIENYIANETRDISMENQTYNEAIKNVSKFLKKEKEDLANSTSLLAKVSDHVKGNLTWYIIIMAVVLLGNTIVSVIYIFHTLIPGTSAELINATSTASHHEVTAFNSIITILLFGCVAIKIFNLIHVLLSSKFTKKDFNNNDCLDVKAKVAALFSKSLGVIVFIMFTICYINHCFIGDPFIEAFSDRWFVVVVVGVLYVNTSLKMLYLTAYAVVRQVDGAIIPTKAPMMLGARDDTTGPSQAWADSAPWFLTLWLLTSLALGIVILIGYLMNSKGIPKTWVTTKKYRAWALFTRMHPVGVKVTRKVNKLDLNEIQQPMDVIIHVGFSVDCVINSIALPPRYDSEAQSVILGSGGTHGIDMSHFNNPVNGFINVKVAENEAYIWVDGAEMVVTTTVNLSELTIKKKSRKTFKESYKRRQSDRLVDEQTRAIDEAINATATVPLTNIVTPVSTKTKQAPERPTTSQPALPTIKFDHSKWDRGIDRETYNKIANHGRAVGKPSPFGNYADVLAHVVDLAPYLKTLGYIL